MKEYICKQELSEVLDKRIEREKITERVLSDVGRGVEFAAVVADSLLGVTKADICREFIVWYTDRIKLPESERQSHIDGWDALIKEFISETGE